MSLKLKKTLFRSFLRWNRHPAIVSSNFVVDPNDIGIGHLLPQSVRSIRNKEGIHGAISYCFRTPPAIGENEVDMDLAFDVLKKLNTYGTELKRRYSQHLGEHGSEFSSAESLDSRAQPSEPVPAPVSAYEGYLASSDASEPEPEPLTSRYIPEAPVTPPRSKRNRPKTILYSATRRNERALQAAIKASLKTVSAAPAVPAVPSAEASSSRMPPPPVVAPVVDSIEGQESLIEAHGRYYTVVEFAQKYCRLHPDPSGKTCK